MYRLGTKLGIEGWGGTAFLPDEQGLSAEESNHGGFWFHRTL
jgi:hypothetical protein